ncbi:uncharacterized protein LOC107797163 isoform X5 [Nicotiana tabacum]|uniref:Uncharacterized protein LOC107797163 isoform X5 n=2 Tax=Nicotiana tabacum TaxID=4097 RepID=A0AC58RT27_TOBAC
MSYVHFYACFLNAPLLNKYHDNTRVIILLWKLRVKNFSKIVVEAILDFRSEHSIQIRRTWRPIRGVKASRAKEVAGLSYRYS